MTYPYFENKNPREANMNLRISSPFKNPTAEKRNDRRTRCVKTLIGTQSTQLTERKLETTKQALLSRGRINN